MIGVFDSAFGGLAVLRELLQVLPEYDYLYLGDNARIPYGTRSDRVVIRFTEQAVDYLFRQGCRLIVLACHTASARALRLIQQACPLLVPIIESGEQEWEGTTLILRRYLAPFKGRVDTLILGCTHYSILKDQVRAI